MSIRKPKTVPRVREMQQDSQEEFDYLVEAYTGGVVPWSQHRAHNMVCEPISKGEVEILGVGLYPQRFVLLSEHNEKHYASEGFFARLKQARAAIPEFLKALGAMLLILSPMLLDGSWI